MTLSTFLQAVISLVFIYLILSLLTSELQEYLATFSEARAKRLKQSIRQMLGEEDWLNEYFIDGKNIKVYFQDAVIPEKSMVWREKANGEKLIPTTKVTFDENDDSPKFIWIDTSNNDFTEDEVLVSPSDPGKAGKKSDANLTRFEVYKVGADITNSSDFSAWEKDGILIPVQDTSKLVREGGTEFIGINVDVDQEVIHDPANKSEKLCPVYKSANQMEIKKDAKVWKQNTNIAKVLSNSVFSDSTNSTSNQEFVWIDTNNQPIDLTQFNVVSYKTDPPTDPEKGAKIDPNLTKHPLYQVLVELKVEPKKDTKYYVNDEKKKIVLPPSSLTEELYKHPNIKALNQTAFRWFWILGISFDYPWKDFKTLKDFNISPESWQKFWEDFNAEDYFNLLSTALLIVFVSCLFFSQILLAFIFFIFFAISRFCSLFSKGKKVLIENL